MWTVIALSVYSAFLLLLLDLFSPKLAARLWTAIASPADRYLFRPAGMAFGGLLFIGLIALLAAPYVFALRSLVGTLSN